MQKSIDSSEILGKSNTDNITSLIKTTESAMNDSQSNMRYEEKKKNKVLRISGKPSQHSTVVNMSKLVGKNGRIYNV